MSADNPPTYYFTGIDFNSSFYTTTTSGSGDLTQVLADTLYLRKTVADTATVVETFSNVNGIKVNKIEPLNTTSNDIVIGSTISNSNRVAIGKSTGGLGVSFPSGAVVNNIDTIGTSGGNGTLTIGGTRAIALNIGKATYSTNILSDQSFPLKVNHISSVLQADILRIGLNNTGGIAIGIGSITSGGVSADGVFFYTTQNPVTSGDEANIIASDNSVLNIMTDSAYIIEQVNIGVKDAVISNFKTTINGLTNIAQNNIGTNPTYISTDSSTTSNSIEFHSNNNFVTSYDSRIRALGGTVNNAEGTLELDAISTTITGITYTDSIDTIVSASILQLGNTASAVRLKNQVDADAISCAVNECYFTLGVGSEATIGTKGITPLYIAPSIAIEPTSTTSSVTIGNSTIPVSVVSNAISLTGATTVSTTLDVTGILTASSGIRTNEVNRITSGSLSIGANALTTAVTIQKPLTLSNPLILGSVPTLSSQLGYTEVNAFIGTAIRTGVESIAGTALASLPAGIWSISYALKVSGDLSAITVTRFYSYVESSPVISSMSILAPSGGANSYAVGTGQTDASINQSGSVIVKTTASTTFTLKYFLTAGNTALFRTGCYLTATRIG